ncbi:hypothetical protein [Marinitoga lauensis]|uniref:hypothetical protein n=1 Tax=Marinitoga lauensis TaxID=2201189 RepID=UPI0010133FCC|nr:hypothetical protein [Marinitoga lauensis]
MKKNILLKFIIWGILILDLIFVSFLFYKISVEDEGLFNSYISLFLNYIPPLITISPFIISQLINAYKIKKQMKPILFLKIHSQEKENINFMVFNYSNNPAFNIEVEILKNKNVVNALNSFKKRKKKFEKALEKLYKNTISQDNKYFIDVVAKDFPHKYIQISMRDLLDYLKAYLYDLINEEDLFFPIKFTYHNEDQIIFKELFKIYFEFEFSGKNNTPNKKEIIHLIENENISFNLKIKKILKVELNM